MLRLLYVNCTVCKLVKLCAINEICLHTMLASKEIRLNLLSSLHSRIENQIRLKRNLSKIEHIFYKLVEA